MVTTVLVADDEPLIRAGLGAVLAADDELLVVAQAVDGRDAVELTTAHRPDVVLMDIRMPRLDGLSAVQEIRRVRPDQAVIVLTTFGEAEYVHRAVALGVNGFLLKSGSPDDLLRGIAAVADGGACLSPSVAVEVLAQLRSRRAPGSGADPAAVTGLPPRDQEVLRLLASGLSNAQIARRLRLTEGTVKGYVSSLFTRLGVTNRVEAALIAWRAGWEPD